jgi:hypothetical protein
MTKKEILALPVATAGFIEPMQIDEVLELPVGRERAYEAKLDGYRCLAGKTSAG